MLGTLRGLSIGLAIVAGLAGAAGAQQRGPIQLFPDLSPTRPAPGEQEVPASPRAPEPGVREAPAATFRAPEPFVERTAPAPAEPPPSTGFQVEGLAAPDVGVIGLDQGFDPEIWRGSDAEIVLALLADLPVETRNPALRDLTRRLLITGAAPDGDVASGRLLELRVDRLIAMGALADAAALLDRLPASAGGSALARRAAEVALWRGDGDRACALADQGGPGVEGAFWGQLVVFCRLRAGDGAGAMLALDLLREAGQTGDDAFFQLADMLASAELDRPLPQLAEPTALHVAMLREAGLALPEGALAAPSPPLLAAIVEAPALAPGRELELAEAAFHAGVLSEEELVQRYLELAPEGAGGALTGVGADWGPEGRAQALAELRDPDPAARAELLDTMWRAADGADRLLVARAFAEAFSELPVADELLFVAPSSARALLAGERPVLAARWFSLLGDAAIGEARAERAALAPLFALAGIGGREQVPEPDLETLTAWRSSTEAADSRALRLYALLEGVGVRVPARAWWDLLDAAAEAPANAPPAPYWRALDHALAARRPAEALLLALHLLGGDPGDVHPEAVVQGLRALRAIGLDQEARRVALASAIALDL